MTGDCQLRQLQNPVGTRVPRVRGHAGRVTLPNVREDLHELPQLVTNDWFKLERMRVFQDRFGRVVQANFAVIDCAKKYDKGSDIHSSKNITIPMNPGRRIETFKKTRRGWEARIAKERGFDPLKDVDVDSLILGPQSMVAFGAGVKSIATDKANGDLVVVFPSVELDSPVVEILGREKGGRLFFATARVDGTKLGFFEYKQP